MRRYRYPLLIPIVIALTLLLTNAFGAREGLLDLFSSRDSLASKPDSETGKPPRAVDSAAPSATPLPVRGVTLAQGPFIQTVRASGRAEAIRRVDLAPRVGERVTAVRVREGDAVTKGQSLIELDPRPFEISLKEAEASRANAEVDAQVQLSGDTHASAEKLEAVAHRSGLTAAQQSVARAELDLESTTLRAPFAAHVARIEAVVGERAVPNQTLLTLVDLSTLRVRAEVLEAAFGSLSTGTRARLRFPAFPDTPFDGTVTALSPEVDPERGTGIAYIDLPNPDGKLKPGMYAEVDIEAATFADRLSVPRDAVLERERRLLVFRAENGRAEWQYVTLGLETEDRVEITSGLSAGDTVLVAGHLTLAHGAPIRVTVEP